MFTKEDYIEWLRLTYTKEDENNYSYGGWELMWAPDMVPYNDAIINKPKRLQELNRLMIEEFPFLLPRNRFTDEPMENYDYSYNEWQAIPFGWQVAFGWKFLHELNILVQALENPSEFRIGQIKEKFGELRVYTNGGQDIYKLVDDYLEISARTCIVCGEPAQYISRGWICPYCEKHVPDKNHADLIKENYVYNQ